MQYPSDFHYGLRRKPICGVLAIAMIGNVTFARATQVIKNNMMSFQKRHGGRTYFPQRCNSLRELGIRFREIRIDEKMTLSKVVAQYCKPDTTYMIDTTSHCVTVRNNRVADQCEIANIQHHGARRCFVKHIVEIM